MWLDMRQDRAIWLILKVREAGIRLNEAGKCMIMQLQLDIRESWGNKASKKIKRSMRLLKNDMAILYNGIPHPK